MSFSGSGTFTINSTGQPVVSGTVISDTVFNALTADLASGLTNCITRDGQSPATANIPMGGNKLTGLASGTAATDAPTLAQVQSGAVQFFTAGGTADVITGTLSPAISAYAAGQTFRFVASGANTGAVTLNLNSLGAKAVTKNGTTALAAGDIPSGQLITVTYDGTQFQLVGVVNQAALSGVTSINGGQLAGMRNRIINGNFDIWQRGTTAVTTVDTYGADRWMHDMSGDTFSSTQGTFTSGDTLFDTGGAKYYTQIAVTSVANTANYMRFIQKIEDVSLLAGKTVTLSFWAKAASGTPQIGVEFVQIFGTGGSPSAQVTGTGQAVTLSTTWAKYTVTATLGSLNGKTLGTTANTSYTQLNFWLDAGATYATRAGSIGQSSKTVSIAQVQLEIGSVATPFEQRPYGMELALCQRYYYRITSPLSDNCFFGSGYSDSTTLGYGHIPFPVTMRTNPSLEQSGTAGDYQVTKTAVNVVCTSVPATGSSWPNGARVLFTTGASQVAGQAILLRSVNTGAYLGFNGEL